MGVVVAGSRNKIEGNFIGTDPSGTTAQGNHLAGVDVEGFLGDAASGNISGGFSPDQHNLISGNEGTGVSLLGELAVSNQVLGTSSVPRRTIRAPLGNSREGVGIFGAPSRARPFEVVALAVIILHTTLKNLWEQNPRYVRRVASSS